MTAAEVPSSLEDTAGTEPWTFYDGLRDRCPVEVNEPMNAWLVSTWAGCRTMLMQDKAAYRHPDGDDERTVAISAGRRQLKLLDGEQHRAMHQWWLRTFSPKETASLQDRLIRQVVSNALDRIRSQGHAELHREFAALIPIRTIAAVLGLPWEDDAWIDRCKALIDISISFFDRRFHDSTDQYEKGLTALAELREILMPVIRARRTSGGEDVISRLWREGPAILPDLTEQDVWSMTYNAFIGGTDTTMLGICNMLYLYLTDDQARREISGNPDLVPGFVEESLRLFSPVQYRARRANMDTDLLGVAIGKDDNVVPVLAAANRDPAKYPHPDRIDLHRTAMRDHLAFNFGPRVCVGAALARAELCESLRQLMRDLPDVALDPAAPPPAFHGLTLRAFFPLHVVF